MLTTLFLTRWDEHTNLIGRIVVWKEDPSPRLGRVQDWGWFLLTHLKQSMLNVKCRLMANNPLCNCWSLSGSSSPSQRVNVRIVSLLHRGSHHKRRAHLIGLSYFRLLHVVPGSYGWHGLYARPRQKSLRLIRGEAVLPPNPPEAEHHGLYGHWPNMRA